MYLPDWIAWGMAETLVLSVGLSAVAFSGMARQRFARRKLGSAMAELRAEVEELNEQLASMEVPVGDGELAIDLLRDRIAALDADRDPVNPQLNAVRRAALSDEAALLNGIRTDALEEALAGITAALLEQAPDAEELQDLKEMLKQVTRDSRSMLECIRDLENECERLRKHVPEEFASPPDSGADDPSSEAA